MFDKIGCFDDVCGSATRIIEWHDIEEIKTFKFRVKTNNTFASSRWGIIIAGLVIGIFAAVLQKLGNPPNMGVCVACFERDIAGALGFHRLSVTQYIRPE